MALGQENLECLPLQHWSDGSPSCFPSYSALSGSWVATASVYKAPKCLALWWLQTQLPCVPVNVSLSLYTPYDLNTVVTVADRVFRGKCSYGARPLAVKEERETCLSAKCWTEVSKGDGWGSVTITWYCYVHKFHTSQHVLQGDLILRWNCLVLWEWKQF